MQKTLENAKKAFEDRPTDGLTNSRLLSREHATKIHKSTPRQSSCKTQFDDIIHHANPLLSFYLSLSCIVKEEVAHSSLWKHFSS